jgi:hypothetical protein
VHSLLSREKVSSDSSVAIVLEAIKFNEALLIAVDDAQRVALLKIILARLIGLLDDDSASSASPSAPFLKTVHTAALTAVKAVGPLFPVEFKSIMASDAAMKAKLETVLKAEMSSQQQRQGTRPVASTNVVVQAAKPSIQLTMNFSAFTKPAE